MKRKQRKREMELWDANTREQLERPRTESSERRNVHTVNASEQHRRGLKRIDKLQYEILRREIDYRIHKFCRTHNVTFDEMVTEREIDGHTVALLKRRKQWGN